MCVWIDGNLAAGRNIVVLEGRASKGEDGVIVGVVDCVAIAKNLKKDWTIAVYFDIVGNRPSEGKSWVIVVEKEEWFGMLAATNGCCVLMIKYHSRRRP